MVLQRVHFLHKIDSLPLIYKMSELFLLPLTFFTVRTADKQNL